MCTYLLFHHISFATCLWISRANDNKQALLGRQPMIIILGRFWFVFTPTSYLDVFVWSGCYRCKNKKIRSNFSGCISCIVFAFPGVPTVGSSWILNSIFLTLLSKFWTVEIGFEVQKVSLWSPGRMIGTMGMVKVPAVHRLRGNTLRLFFKRHFMRMHRRVFLLFYYL